MSTILLLLLGCTASATSTKRHLHRAKDVRYCADLPKFLNTSVQQAWTKTRTLGRRVQDTLDIRSLETRRACVEVGGTDVGLKHLGKELVKLFGSTRCLIMMNYEYFSNHDVNLVNEIDTLVTEITGNPLICVRNKRSTECSENELSELYSLILHQVRILESIHTQIGSASYPPSEN